MPVELRQPVAGSLVLSCRVNPFDSDRYLASEQVAMQGLHCYQVTAQAAAATARKGITLPPMRLYSDLPREWTMARLCILYTNK